MSPRGQTIWNEFFGTAEKKLEPISLFKARVKSKVLEIKNEITCFKNYPNVFLTEKIQQHCRLIALKNKILKPNDKTSLGFCKSFV